MVAGRAGALAGKDWATRLGGNVLGDRLMVGQVPLEHVVQVRILVAQPEIFPPGGLSGGRGSTTIRDLLRAATCRNKLDSAGMKFAVDEVSKFEVLKFRSLRKTSLNLADRISRRCGIEGTVMSGVLLKDAF